MVGDIVCRMVLQPRVMDSANLGAATEVRGDHRSRVVVPSDPQVQRANPASDQPGVTRPEHRTDVQRCHPDLVHQALWPHDHSRRCVRMPGQILRRAVPDQVYAKLQRSLIHGVANVVRQRQNPARSRNIRYGAQVGDFQTRVAWRLDKEQPRRRRDRALPSGNVGLIHQRVVYPEARQQLLDQAERTPVMLR